MNLPGHWAQDLKGVDQEGGGTHKLSCGPNIFVGIAEVKLHPNSSLYALQSADKKSSNLIVLEALTDSAHRPFSLHAHNRSYSHAAGQNVSSSHSAGK